MSKKYFALLLLVIVALTIKKPLALTSFIKGSTSSFSEEEKKVRSIYTINFDNNKNYYGYINVYKTRFNPPQYDIANYYSQLFNVKDNFVETDEYYAYLENGIKLYIYKDINLVKYQNNNISLNNTVKVNTETAVLKAKEFFKENYINLTYEEAFVEYDSGLYHISFVGRLNNLKNFAFKNNVTMDKYGNILDIKYYYNTYENIGKAKIMSVNEAFYNLPIDFDHNKKIYIYNFQLVYLYENSILQPAYFFQGKFLDGNIFESFVIASVYK